MEAARSRATPAPAQDARRNYIIDRGFQLKYTLTLVLAGAVISVLFGAMMYLAHLDAQRSINPPPELREQLARVDGTLLFLMISISVMMATAFGLFGILITHRVAGPVFVMSHYIGVLSRGRYPLLRPLRKKDELQELFQRFQDALELMRQREVEEAETIQLAVDALTPSATSPEALSALDRLRAVRDRKKDATDRIDVAGIPLIG